MEVVRKSKSVRPNSVELESLLDEDGDFEDFDINERFLLNYEQRHRLFNAFATEYKSFQSLVLQSFSLDLKPDVYDIIHETKRKKKKVRRRRNRKRKYKPFKMVDDPKKRLHLALDSQYKNIRILFQKYGESNLYHENLRTSIPPTFPEIERLPPGLVRSGTSKTSLLSRTSKTSLLSRTSKKKFQKPEEEDGEDDENEEMESVWYEPLCESNWLFQEAKENIRKRESFQNEFSKKEKQLKKFLSVKEDDNRHFENIRAKLKEIERLFANTGGSSPGGALSPVVSRRRKISVKELTEMSLSSLREYVNTEMERLKTAMIREEMRRIKRRKKQEEKKRNKMIVNKYARKWFKFVEDTKVKKMKEKLEMGNKRRILRVWLDEIRAQKLHKKHLLKWSMRRLKAFMNFNFFRQKSVTTIIRKVYRRRIFRIVFNILYQNSLYRRRKGYGEGPVRSYLFQSTLRMERNNEYWESFCEKKRMYYLFLDDCRKYYRKRLKRKFFIHFVDYLSWKVTAKRKLRMMVNRRERKIKKRCFRALYKHMVKRRYEEKPRLALKLKYFNILRKQVILSKQKRHFKVSMLPVIKKTCFFWNWKSAFLRKGITDTVTTCNVLLKQPLAMKYISLLVGDDEEDVDSFMSSQYTLVRCFQNMQKYFRKRLFFMAYVARTMIIKNRALKKYYFRRLRYRTRERRRREFDREEVCDEYQNLKEEMEKDYSRQNSVIKRKFTVRNITTEIRYIYRGWMSEDGSSDVLVLRNIIHLYVNMVKRRREKEVYERTKLEQKMKMKHSTSSEQVNYITTTEEYEDRKEAKLSRRKKQLKKMQNLLLFFEGLHTQRKLTHLFDFVEKRVETNRYLLGKRKTRDSRTLQKFTRSVTTPGLIKSMYEDMPDLMFEVLEEDTGPVELLGREYWDKVFIWGGMMYRFRGMVRSWAQSQHTYRSRIRGKDGEEKLSRLTYDVVFKERMMDFSYRFKGVAGIKNDKFEFFKGEARETFISDIDRNNLQLNIQNELDGLDKIVGEDEEGEGEGENEGEGEGGEQEEEVGGEGIGDRVGSTTSVRSTTSSRKGRISRPGTGKRSDDSHMNLPENEKNAIRKVVNIKSTSGEKRKKTSLMDEVRSEFEKKGRMTKTPTSVKKKKGKKKKKKKIDELDQVAARMKMRLRQIDDEKRRLERLEREKERRKIEEMKEKKRLEEKKKKERELRQKRKEMTIRDFVNLEVGHLDGVKDGEEKEKLLSDIIADIENYRKKQRRAKKRMKKKKKVGTSVKKKKGKTTQSPEKDSKEGTKKSKKDDEEVGKKKEENKEEKEDRTTTTTETKTDTKTETSDATDGGKRRSEPLLVPNEDGKKSQSGEAEVTVKDEKKPKEVPSTKEENEQVKDDDTKEVTKTTTQKTTTTTTSPKKNEDEEQKKGKEEDEEVVVDEENESKTEDKKKKKTEEEKGEVETEGEAEEDTKKDDGEEVEEPSGKKDTTTASSILAQHKFVKKLSMYEKHILQSRIRKYHKQQENERKEEMKERMYQKAAEKMMEENRVNLSQNIMSHMNQAITNSNFFASSSSKKDDLLLPGLKKKKKKKKKKNFGDVMTPKKRKVVKGGVKKRKLDALYDRLKKNEEALKKNIKVAKDTLTPYYLEEDDDEDGDGNITSIGRVTSLRTLDSLIDKVERRKAGEMEDELRRQDYLSTKKKKMKIMKKTTTTDSGGAIKKIDIVVTEKYEESSDDEDVVFESNEDLLQKQHEKEEEEELKVTFSPRLKNTSKYGMEELMNLNEEKKPKVLPTTISELVKAKRKGKKFNISFEKKLVIERLSAIKRKTNSKKSFLLQFCSEASAKKLREMKRLEERKYKELKRILNLTIQDRYMSANPNEWNYLMSECSQLLRKVQDVINQVSFYEKRHVEMEEKRIEDIVKQSAFSSNVQSPIVMLKSEVIKPVNLSQDGSSSAISRHERNWEFHVEKKRQFEERERKKRDRDSKKQVTITPSGSFSNVAELFNSEIFVESDKKEKREGEDTEGVSKNRIERIRSEKLELFKMKEKEYETEKMKRSQTLDDILIEKRDSELLKKDGIVNSSDEEEENEDSMMRTSSKIIII